MTLRHGFDVSAYQGYDVIKADFGWVKATEGTGYRSSKFSRQWQSANKLWEVPGVYHFARPERSSAKSQVSYLRSVCGDLHPGTHMAMLDLEASGLNQAGTNNWAKEFGDELRRVFPGVTTVLYAGGGYATNNTGKGLKDHFDFWCYPQYPSAYQVTHGIPFGQEMQRSVNRSNETIERRIVATAAKGWAESMDEMWLPKGITLGWPMPHFWQFTDHWPGGIDASVSSLTVEQMKNGAGASSTQEANVYGGTLGPGETKDLSFPHGSLRIFGVVSSAPTPQSVTLEINHKDAETSEKTTLTVGGTRPAKGGLPKKKTYSLKNAKDADWATITNNGDSHIGWDAS